jgi:folate-dependent phosphoribosylglycinamide formyltransferase PurN
LKKIIILTFEGNPIATELFSLLEREYSVFVLFTKNTNLSLKQLWKRKRGFRWFWYNNLFSLYAKKYNINHVPKPGWEEVIRKNRDRFFKVKRHNSSVSKEKIEDLKCDLGILIGTELIKSKIYDIPLNGMINLHQGNIPLYRGAPPGFWEHFNGEKEMFVSVHFVVDKVDAGCLLVENKFSIERFKHYVISKYHANSLSVKMLKQGVENVFNGIEPEKRSIGSRPNTVPGINTLLNETYKLFFR